MALIFLKNSIFGRRRSLSAPKPSSEHRSSISEDTVCEDDLESQPLLASRSRTEKQPARFTVNARVISDATIGLSDGLTVPFALTAGLSALGQTRVVIFGGLAELIAGAISMGLGGYLGAKSEEASYLETRKETARLILDNASVVRTNIEEVFEPFELPSQTLAEITQHLSASPKLLDFMMQFQHCTTEPASSRALISALTIAGGYLFGGLVPLIPYFCVPPNDVYLGLYISIGVMAIALFAFGYMKTCIVVGWRGGRCVRQGVWGGVEMIAVGGAAAGAAMGLVKAFDSLAQQEDSIFFLGVS